MLSLSFLPRLRMALLAILTLALVATGWAHRAPEVSGEALAFMLATGATTDDFCGDVGGAKHADPMCQACQIVGGADVSPPSGAVLPLKLTVGAAPLCPRNGIVVARILDLSHAPQGPPRV
jgi:hypothetical protein